MFDNKITKVKKRDGSIVLFNQNRLVNAIFKSAQSVGGSDKRIAEDIAEKVVLIMNERLSPSEVPSVEHIQDLLEKILIEEGHASTAKAFILYREERKKIREAKKAVLDGLLDDSKLDLNQVKILARKYLARDKEDRIKETPTLMFKRVAKALAKNEKEVEKAEKELAYFNVMRRLDFLPSGRVLANADLRSKQLASCYVLPIPDSISGMFDSLKLAALIQKAGAGTGYDFSMIRPQGAKVASSKSKASGPVSFMRLFDAMTETIKQGSNRGANMGILRVDHPDIIEFITSKKDLDRLTNFNISVSITDEFMNAVIEKNTYDLIDPLAKKPITKASALKVFDLLVRQAWETGEPGLIFLDTINKYNVLPGFGDITATDPCGEFPMHPYESSVLGSINLSHMVNHKRIDWQRLRKTVHLGVEMLDNALDVSTFPDEKCEKMMKRTRKIGLGIMGFADMLYQLRISYNSDDAVSVAKKIMAFIRKESHKRSSDLARSKRPFGAYSRSIYINKAVPMRNSAVTSIGPTGTISMVADTSPGCEPNFGLGFIKNVLENEKYFFINQYFEEAAKEHGFYSEDLMKKVAEYGTVEDMDDVPKKYQKIFVVAHQVLPEYHIKIQAALQENVDSAISKTINFTHNATLDDVRKGFLLAWKLGCKGITIYRDGSRLNQVFNIKEVNKEVKSIDTSGFA